MPGQPWALGRDALQRSCRGSALRHFAERQVGRLLGIRGLRRWRQGSGFRPFAPGVRFGCSGCFLPDRFWRTERFPCFGDNRPGQRREFPGSERLGDIAERRLRRVRRRAGQDGIHDCGQRRILPGRTRTAGARLSACSHSVRQVCESAACDLAVAGRVLVHRSRRRFCSGGVCGARGHERSSGYIPGGH